MKTHIINKNWLFHIEDEKYRISKDASKKDVLTTFGFLKTGEASGFAARRYEDLPWRRVDLPHDYVVELGFDSMSRSANGLKPVNDSLFGDDPIGNGRTETPVFPIAWYRKEFFIDDNGDLRDGPSSVFGDIDNHKSIPDGIRYFLRFEGVYRDFTVWVNGVYIDRVTCGYLGVTFDVTDQLILGETNTVAVRVDCSQYDGWWYDGGGIYRDVKLLVGEDCYCHPEDLYIHTSPDGRISVAAELTNKGYSREARLTFAVSKNGEELLKVDRAHPLSYGKNSIFEQLVIDSPRLWDVDDPQLYTLSVRIDGEPELEIPFGFKEVRFDPDEGFFLNGRSLKLNGVCLHQDLAGVGVALPYELTYYKYKTMKEMGANAVRMVHNPPSPDALEICDRLGLLVMDETRMFGSSEEALRQLDALVKRDRNHACLLMWSIGNEEHSVQNNEWGARMARTVKRRIESLTTDPIITYGANNGRRFEGVNSEMLLRGINYIRISNNNFHPDDYHIEHPHQVIYCSEEMSSLTTRGIYRNDIDGGYVDAYGENGYKWTSTPMGYMKFAMSRPYFCGGFAWTGFDYRGEPSPFTGSIIDKSRPRNTVSNFGITDLCGFPKDIYYYYRAHWRSEPSLHLLPHWNFNEGEAVRVVAFTNCDEVTLYLNGRKISTEKIEPYGVPEWTIPFEAGELRTVGRKGDIELTAVRRTAEAVGLRILTESYGEYILATVEAVDSYGEICATSNDTVRIFCEGAEVIGVGNGDPTARLRERYFEEEEIRPIPPFATDRPLTSPVPPTRTTVREEKHPRFEDSFRTLWCNEKREEKEYTYKTEFEADESYSFLEFSAIRGEARIFLNGEEIGYTPPASDFILKRPYRFDCSFINGVNKLTVKLLEGKDRAAALENAFIGQRVMPKVEHSLFNGRMLLILRKKDKGRIVAESSSGFCAEAFI
ncbi:MAG: glycoside hydrolase family 2 protein [Ruminococcaceae bacterium]|nr:glycoside hydrolase family 2 protein [Oscillospiraceae bacterium]